jgi:hypothetical protein
MFRNIRVIYIPLQHCRTHGSIEVGKTESHNPTTAGLTPGGDVQQDHLLVHKAGRFTAVLKGMGSTLVSQPLSF